MNTHAHGEQLSAYLDGMMDVAQMHRIAQHLSVCPSCRASLDSLRQTKALLRELEAPAPAPEFWANTYRRLRVEGASGQSGSWQDALRQSLRGTSRRWAVGVAALAALGAIIAAPLLSPPSNPQPTQPALIESDFVDVSSLVRDHATSAARQPLADPDRQTMLAADVDDLADFGDTPMEASGDATTADAAH